MSDSKLFSHGLRAAINTPIQGGAADVVVAAMIKLFQNKRLREIRYKIILQIHDEVILVNIFFNCKIGRTRRTCRRSITNYYRYYGESI